MASACRPPCAPSPSHAVANHHQWPARQARPRLRRIEAAQRAAPLALHVQTGPQAGRCGTPAHFIWAQQTTQLGGGAEGRRAACQVLRAWQVQRCKGEQAKGRLSKAAAARRRPRRCRSGPRMHRGCTCCALPAAPRHEGRQAQQQATRGGERQQRSRGERSRTQPRRKHVGTRRRAHRGRRSDRAAECGLVSGSGHSNSGRRSGSAERAPPPPPGAALCCTVLRVLRPLACHPTPANQAAPWTTAAWRVTQGRDCNVLPLRRYSERRHTAHSRQPDGVSGSMPAASGLLWGAARQLPGFQPAPADTRCRKRRRSTRGGLSGRHTVVLGVRTAGGRAAAARR